MDGDAVSALITVYKLRERQRIGKWAETAVSPAWSGAHQEWWAGYAAAMADVAAYCRSMMPEGKWLPEDGDG